MVRVDRGKLYMVRVIREKLSGCLCCTVHRVLYSTLGFAPHNQGCICCTLHSMLYLTLSVVPYTQSCMLHSVL